MAPLNVLVIMTDQQRGDALAAAGNQHIETPNFDALVRSGACFTRAFTESPECIPARGIVLTGKLPAETGAVANVRPLREGAFTYARALRDAGWATWAVGKQHFVPARSDHGFDHLELSEELVRDPAADEYTQYLFKVGFGWVHEPAGVRHELYYVPQPSQLPDEHHMTTWVGDRTVQLLEESAASGRPFLGVASFVKPHPPFDPTVPYLTRYDPEAMPNPVAATPDATGFPIEQAQSFFKWREETPAALARTLKAYYYACITQLDVQVGRMLESLDALGLREQTLIIFLSDHGELLGDHGHWGKRSFYEGSTRIPLVVSWPGRVPAGVVNDHVAGQQDVAPTILAAAGLHGLTEEQGLRGHDLVADANGTGREPRDAIVGTLYQGAPGIVGALGERFRWSYSVAGGKERLFDLEVDPQEQHNLVGDSTYSDIRAELRTTAQAHLREHDTLGFLDGDDLAVAPEPPDADVGWFFGRSRQYSSYGRPQIPESARAAVAVSMRDALEIPKR